LLLDLKDLRAMLHSSRTLRRADDADGKYRKPLSGRSRALLVLGTGRSQVLLRAALDLKDFMRADATGRASSHPVGRQAVESQSSTDLPALDAI